MTTDTRTQQPVAIVTGASSGIGKQCAILLARKGYHVLLAARRDDRLQQIAQECIQAGAAGKVVAVRTDVAREDQVQALVHRAVEDYGRLDVMINNAGYGVFARVHETTDQQMRGIFDVNYHGVFYGSKAAAEVMIRQRSGHIFNVSSVIGKRGTPFHGAYCATKFAVAGLTDSMRVELRPYNVRVTLVCPALTQTDFFDQSSGGGAARSSFVKFKKLMSAEAVARRTVATIGKGRPELIFTAGGRFLTIVSCLFPRLADAMMKLYHDDLIKRM